MSLPAVCQAAGLGFEHHQCSTMLAHQQQQQQEQQLSSAIDGVGDVGGIVPTAARQGRHRQRYGSNGERLVAGCIPVRVTTRGAAVVAVDVLLISSRAGKGYCFPKGGWEDDETVEAAAKRETVEEAGVRGVLEEPMVGIFPFQSGKAGHKNTIHQGKCTAYMYVMHVAEELDVWPESSERQRIWCPLAVASSKCRHDWMKEALNIWVCRKGWQHLLDLPAAQPSGGAISSSSETSDASDSELSRQSFGCLNASS